MKKIILLSALIVLQTISLAQEESGNHIPSLNGHQFIPVNDYPMPFINSSFGMNLGIASTKEFESLLFEIDGEKVYGLKGALLFADLNFSYQQKVKDWIAFYANYGGTARLGTDVQSLLSQGVNTVNSFKLGWLVKISSGEKHMLSGSLEVNNYNATLINISGFVKDLVLDSTITSITRNIPILNSGAGLRYAYGINKTFGFQAFADVGYGEGIERGATDFIYRIGGIIEADLAQTTKVPIGFSLFLNVNSIPTIVLVQNKSAVISGLKISATGNEHFNLGLEISTFKIPVPNLENKVSGISAIVSTRYFFD